MLNALCALTLLSPALALQDDGKTKIEIRIKHTEERTQKTDDSDDEKKHKKHRRHHDDTEECDCDEKNEGAFLGHHPRYRLLTGTYTPRDGAFGAPVNTGNLKQYSLASQGYFADYFKGNGPIKTEIIGVGMQSKIFRANGPVAPFLGWGWGVYNARTTAPAGSSAALSNSQTRLAWKLRLGLDVPFGVVELQVLDARFKQGLRGSSLLFGLRY